MPWFLQLALALKFLGRGIKQASDKARDAGEAKWRTPVGYRYPEPWNKPDPPNTLSASEADQYSPERRSDRRFVVGFGIFLTLMWLAGAHLGYRLQSDWLLGICSILALLAADGTINARQGVLEEVTNDLRCQRRQVKFNVAVEQGTACLNCRRGKPKTNPICPACGFNSRVYSAEAAAKKAVRYAMKTAVRLTAKAAWLTTKIMWEATKGAAKFLWWSFTPPKKRFSKNPSAA